MNSRRFTHPPRLRNRLATYYSLPTGRQSGPARKPSVAAVSILAVVIPISIVHCGKAACVAYHLFACFNPVEKCGKACRLVKVWGVHESFTSRWPKVREKPVKLPSMSISRVTTVYQHCRSSSPASNTKGIIPVFHRCPSCA